jgi:hypothetical protein
MCCDKGLEFTDQIGVSADCQVGRDPFLGNYESRLLEARDRTLGEGFIGEIRQGRSTPESECASEQLGGVVGSAACQCVATFLSESSERVRVQLVRGEYKGVAGRASLEAGGSDHGAQARQVGAERRLGGRRRITQPEFFDQPVARHHLTLVQKQER